MLNTFVLNQSQLPALATGDRVLVNSTAGLSDGFDYTPALTVCVRRGSFVFVYIGPNVEAMQDEMPLSSYGNQWNLHLEDGFLVNTPDGILHAYSKRDPEYPGISVYLYRSEDEQPIGLSMTEYIPGGEGLCGWDPNNPGLARQEIAEVPVERIETEDGKPVTNKYGITPANAGNYRISAGLVTRAWEDELSDVDSHRRVFHYGYDS